MHIVNGIAALLVVLLAVIYAYLCRQLGASSIHAAIRLCVRGCIKFNSLTWSPLVVKNVAIQQPQALGGFTVFEADTLGVQWLGKGGMDVTFTKPSLSFLGDSEGLLHIVALLQDVGFLTESRIANTSAINLPDDDGAEVATTTARIHEATFEGEARASIAHLLFKDGTLAIPWDVGQIIGNSVQATAAAGTANVCQSSKGTDESSDDWWTRSTNETSTSGRVRYPVMLRLRSDNIFVTLNGWRTDLGFLLRGPIKSLVHFTPEIAQLALSKLHPLLGFAVSLQGSDQMQATLSPLHMHLPCEMISLRLEPLKVTLKTKAMVTQLIKFLQFAGKKDWQEPHTLEAWTSTIAADVHRNGKIVSKRMDMLLGHNVRAGKGIHISMWGSVDAGTNAVDMVLGLPSHTLQRLGARDLDPDYVYTLPVSGTAQSPDIDWLRAGKDLAEIILKSKMQKGLPFLRNVFQKSSERRRSKSQKAITAVPPPNLPFPWEAFQTAVDVDKDSLLAHHNTE